MIKYQCNVKCGMPTGSTTQSHFTRNLKESRSTSTARREREERDQAGPERPEYYLSTPIGQFFNEDFSFFFCLRLLIIDTATTQHETNSIRFMVKTIYSVPITSYEEHDDPTGRENYDRGATPICSTPAYTSWWKISSFTTTGK